MQGMIRQLLQIAGDCDGLIRLFEEELLNDADARTRGGTLLELATELHPIGRNDCALAVVRRARTYFEDAVDNKGVCYTWINEGIYQDELGNLEEALDSFRRAAEVNQELRDESIASKIEVGLGRAYNKFARFETAIAHFRRAERLKERIGDVVGLGKCKMGLGLAYRALGAFEEAEGLFRKVITISRQVEDLETEAHARTNLGNTFIGMSRFDEALAEHRSSLAIGEELDHRGIIASAYVNIGITLGNLGDFQGAIESNKRALELTQNPSERGTALQNIGNGYFNLGDFQRSLGYFEQALKIKESLRELEGLLLCLMNTGNSYGSLGQYEKAIELQERALGVARGIGDRYNESLCLSNLGVSFFLMGSEEAAIEHLREAGGVAREIGAPHLESQAEFGLARVYYEGLKNLEASYRHCARAIDLGEALTQGLAHQDSKISFFGKLAAPYEYMLRCCLELGGKESEAFAVLERSKSRSLVEMLSTQPIGPRKGAGAELAALVAREESLIGTLRELQTRAWRLPGSSPSLEELKRVHGELKDLYERITAHDPEYVSLRRGGPITAEEVKRFVDAAERPMILIEYFLGADFVAVFLISSREESLKIFTKEIPRRRLFECLEDYQRVVVNHARDEEASEKWLDMADFLLDPIGEYVQDGDLICFVPHNVLHFIPLHALPIHGEPIIRRHPVVYAPSSSVLLGLRRKQEREPCSCVAFGVAMSAEQEASHDLPPARVRAIKDLFEGEAVAVAAQYGGLALTGNGAAKRNFAEVTEVTDIVHFSCHGYFNAVDPLASGLLMYDGELTAREVFGAKLGSEVVVLSACESAITERSIRDRLSRPI